MSGPVTVGLTVLLLACTGGSNVDIGPTLLLFGRARYELLVYAVTGDVKDCVGDMTPGGGAFIKLRLLLRRPSDGAVEPP